MFSSGTQTEPVSKSDASVQTQTREIYQIAKSALLERKSVELQALCLQYEFAPGCGATKEAMARGLLAEPECYDKLVVEMRERVFAREDSTPKPSWRSSCRARKA